RSFMTGTEPTSSRFINLATSVTLSCGVQQTGSLVMISLTFFMIPPLVSCLLSAIFKPESVTFSEGLILGHCLVLVLIAMDATGITQRENLRFWNSGLRWKDISSDDRPRAYPVWSQTGKIFS